MLVYVVITVRATNLTSIIIVSHKNIANCNKFSSFKQNTASCHLLSFVIWLPWTVSLKREKEKGEKRYSKERPNSEAKELFKDFTTLCQFAQS